MVKQTINILLFTLLGAVAGYALGRFLGEIELGVLTGVLIGLPIGFYVNSKRRRWIAVAALNIALVASWRSGHEISLLFTATAAFLGFAVAAFILRDLYGTDEVGALVIQLRMAFGGIQGIHVVEDGKTTTPKGNGPFFGPRQLIVRPGSAAVTVRGRTRAAYGAGFPTTQPYEYVKFTYNLHEQQKRYTFDNVLTNDLMSAQVRLCVTYALDVNDDVRLGRATLTDEERRVGLTAVDQRRLCDLPFRMPDWHDGVRSSVEQAVRQATRAFALETLLQEQPLRQLGDIICHEAELRTREWGVRVESIVLEEIAANPDINAAMNSRWLERARAEGFQTAIGIIAQTYQKATGEPKMSDEQIRREIARHALQELAKDPSGKLILTPELNELLNGLAR